MGQRKPDKRKLRTLARRYLWWESPEAWERDPDRLIRQVLSLGTIEDYRLVRAHFGRERIIRSLQSAPAGAIDPRSWSYWHGHFDLPVPPPPRRGRPHAET
jgi:hypothetical protein